MSSAFEQSGCEVLAGPVAVAVGGRANMPGLSGTPTLRKVVTAAAQNQSVVSILDTGGSPQQVATLDLTLKSKNPDAAKREAAENATALAQALAGVTAATPEANPLEALNQAAEAVAGPGPGTVVLIDSGLQTAGAFSYAQGNAVNTSPEDLVAAIETAGQLPDLTGKTVFLIGLGDTAAPQAPLDAAARRNLQAQWEAIATAAGASCLQTDPTTLAGQGRAALLPVTAVQIEQSTFVPPAPGKPVVLRDEVKFRSDSDEFLDADGARTALEPIAAWLRQERTAILLTGTTATDGTEEGRVRLSQMRADQVARALVALGADPSLIQTEGVGTNHPDHQDDLGPNGELLPGPAAQNRAVIITVR
jgi:outer membrane protein OmpA-like peptidoglycan-associated protein